jgi:hypothetical protein
MICFVDDLIPIIFFSLDTYLLFREMYTYQIHLHLEISFLECVVEPVLK